ncbi:NAD-dependent protein deacetylase [Auraticoccus monumenti]|uniref:NAD-dependent protein deacetylase n=1 Tax=Auraticoccus monumenti TaxID=675864 RepID=A0A1G7C7B9_9ACTN|nr:NAD-dependent protein deacetylase [Auraticoccus monumenti]SDE35208.1 NAD-dependent protein deacetylase, SIR2 family [Auraticoccus monumenti]
MRRRAVDWTHTLDAGARLPPEDPERALAELAETVAAHPTWTVLSGAGLSTESGIPDYRGPSGVRRSSDPMAFDDFCTSADARRRYWARSHLGWRRIGSAHPNAGHRAVAELQRRGRVGGVVTQNVDGLHQAAGSTGVIDLHGTLDVVVCLDCGSRSDRVELERRLTEANPGFDQLGEDVRRVNPDGDVELDEEQEQRFRTVPCLVCGSDRLKPDVVFFGESVPKDRVERAYAELDRDRGLLVLGSSLSVMSGYRFVRHAARQGYPVVIVNQGATRGDREADLLVWLPLGRALPGVVERLSEKTE